MNVAFGADGKTLASSSDDHTIILWDVSNPYAPQKLGALVGQSDSIESVIFSPDGKTLASSSCGKTDNEVLTCIQGEIILWNIDPINWQAQVCQIAGRNLTRVEWQQYMGDEPYRKTCEQWPLEPESTPTPTP